MVHRFVLLIVLAFAPLAANAGDPSPVGTLAEHAYFVGPSDILRIEIYGEEDLSGSQRVSEDGTVFVPLVEQVEVGGLTAQQVATRITEMLGEYLVNPQVSVQIETYQSQKVAVVGAVKKPGEYYLSGPTTLLDIIARAGNVDSEKSAREVRVRRNNGDTLVISLDGLVTGEGDILLRADDVVTIPEGQFVYIAGEVAKPGAVVFWEGLTVTQALTKVGGPSETARLRGAYILRDGDRIPVNLRRILDGREADIALEPGDQLVLKESPI